MGNAIQAPPLNISDCIYGKAWNAGIYSISYYFGVNTHKKCVISSMQDSTIPRQIQDELNQKGAVSRSPGTYIDMMSLRILILIAYICCKG